MELRELSPFFQAIRLQQKWAVELMCDHGANIKTPTSNGMSPLLYAAVNGYDDIALYLCLRVNDVDIEDDTGKNVFLIYMIRQDLERMSSILTRGANINYVSQVSNLTPLHYAIEHRMRPSMIKFLLKNNANPHIVDEFGQDCCDKASKVGAYNKFSLLCQNSCKENPHLRIPVSYIRK